MESITTPKVSVCVITYNQVDHIRQCLQSIVQQETDFDFEVIVGDDFSTDGTREIVKGFAERYPGIVKALLHDKNIGSFNNYKAVHSQAVGEYVAHCDGDDYWLQNKLRDQTDFLNDHRECVAVYTNAILLDTNNEFMGIFNNTQPETFNIEYLLRKGNFLNNSSMMYRRRFNNIILEINGPAIDYRIHLRLARYGHMGYLNRTLVIYKKVTTSAINSSSKFISELYWEALKEHFSVTEYRCEVKHSICHFISSIICSKLLGKKWHSLSYWFYKIKHESPFNIWVLLLFGITGTFTRILFASMRSVLKKFQITQPLSILFIR